jgi:hypothetical protein
VRIEPFAKHFLKLQGGFFDHPDRMFHSIEEVCVMIVLAKIGNIAGLAKRF